MSDDEVLLKTSWNMLHNPIQTRHWEKRQEFSVQICIHDNKENSKS